MDISDWASIIVAAANAATLIVAIMQLRKAVSHYDKGVDHDRKKDTLDAFNRLQTEALDKIYCQYSREKIKEIAAHPLKTENNGEYHLLGTYLARIEHFSAGVNNGVYDKDTTFELAHGFLDGTIKDWIGPLIEKKNSYDGKEYYGNTKKLLNEMAKRSSR